MRTIQKTAAYALVLAALLGHSGCGRQALSLGVAPRQARVAPGDTVDLRVDVRRPAGVHGPVALRLEGAPWSFVAPDVVMDRRTSTVRMPVSIPFSTAPGRYTLAVEGTAAGARRVLGRTEVEVEPVEPILQPHTRVLTAEAKGSLRAYGADGTLVFAPGSPFAAALAPGLVLAAEPTAAAPSGFLRRVTAVSRDADGSVRAATVQATLPEAVVQASWSLRQPLTPADVAEAQPLLPGVRILDGGGGGAGGAPAHGPDAGEPSDAGPSFKVSANVVLYDADGDRNSTDDQLRATGEAEFTLQLEVGVGVEPAWDIPPWEVSAVAAASLTESVSLTVEGKAGGYLKAELPIASYMFSPIVVWAGIPLVFIPRFTLVVGVDGEISGEVSWGFVQTFDMGAGVSYDGDYHNLTRFSPPAVQQKPIRLGARARVGVYGAGQFTIRLYDLAGPSLSLRAGVDLEGTVPRRPAWSLYAAIEGLVGFHVPILGLHYDATLFRERWHLADAPPAPPRVAITSPANNERVPYGGFGVRLGASVTDAEEGDACCVVVWRSDRDGVIGRGRALQYAVASPGTHRFTVTATDSDGMATSATVSVRAGNVPPVVALQRPGPATRILAGLGTGLSARIDDPNEIGVDLCPTLTWTSSRADDAQLRGCSPTAVFAAPGPRTLTLAGRDRQGTASNVVSVPIDVRAAEGLTASIVKPAVGQDLPFNMRGPVQGSVVNPAGTPLTYRWTLAVDDAEYVVGTGLAWEWTPGEVLPEATRCRSKPATLTLAVEDAQGRTATATNAFTIAFPPC